MKNYRLGVRQRLTLFNVLILLFVQVVVSGAIYLYQDMKLKESFQSLLTSNALQVVDILEYSGGDLYDVFNLGQDRHILILKNETVEYATDAWQRDLYPITSRWRGPATLYSGPDKNPRDELILDEGRLKPYRLVKLKELTHGFDVVFALDSTPLAKERRKLAAIYAGSIPFAAILVVLAGFFLAKQAMRPVRQLTQRTETINAESLSRRLPVPGAKDEISELTLVINEMLDRLEDSFNRLKQFTADASHELRTPLTAIRAAAEIELSKPSGTVTSSNAALEGILEEVNLLTGLLDDLLTLARSDMEQDHQDLEDFELTEFLSSTINHLAPLAEESRVSMHFNAEQNFKLNTSTTLLRQAFVNILHNAIKYSPQGGQIAVATETQKNGTILISVDDEGPGIPENEREKVFDRFYRLDSSRSRSSGGFGLGLAIAKWAVEMTGGEIIVETSKLGGSSFRIYLSSKSSFIK